MKKYDPGDEATFYFVVLEKDDKKSIVAWSDDKELTKLYLDFHKCKDFKLKTVKGTIEEIRRILDENTNDEIKLMNIKIRDPKHKKGENETKMVVIPGTEFLSMFIHEEEQGFLSTRIRYNYINSAMPYLKNKYRKALEGIFMQDMINAAIHNRPSRLTIEMQFDELLIITRNFPEQFGE